jgi:hypothetical protein
MNALLVLLIIAGVVAIGFVWVKRDKLFKGKGGGGRSSGGQKRR